MVNQGHWKESLWIFTLWMEIIRLWVMCCFQRWVLYPVEWEGRGLGQHPLPSEGTPAHQDQSVRLWGRPLDLILGAAALIVHTDGEERLGSLGTEMSKGLSLTLELTFLWPNYCFWVALRGMPHARLLRASPAVVRLAEAGPETPWSPVPSRRI